ncbi:hypothetical protein [Neobacillus jeddahensis]|uniref:hypothetical protein n=1 Tax=Neobacillus jeddahensis TaxID=1461580 RepID=UPI000B1B92AD|nr:hypothetical protein [Neobacillus jeddahensis]
MQTNKFKKGLLYIRMNSATVKYLKITEGILSEFLNDYRKNYVSKMNFKGDYYGKSRN